MVTSMETPFDSSPPRGVQAETSRWPHAEFSHYVEIDGVRWHWQRMGAGTPLLLIHGTGSAALSWRDVMPELATAFEVISIDLPGHGQSARLDARAISLASMSSAVGSLLAHLDFAPRAVVGHSAGMAIALRMALDGGIDPQRLIGVNAALLPYRGIWAGTFGGLAKMFAALPLVPSIVARRAADTAAIERLLESTGSTLDADGIALYQRLFVNEDHVRATLSMMASWDLGSMLDDMASLSARIALIVGDGDQTVSPSEAQTLRARYPDIEVVTMAGLGHLAHEERPLEAAALIRGLATSEGEQE